MYITAHAFTGTVLEHAARHSDSARSPIRRTLWERFLWGAAPEHCDDCGIEVKASQAIRYPGGRVYCSLGHAIAAQDD